MSLMPILIIGIVFGLAMDYEVFLLTRMREAYVHGASPGEAIVSGFRHSGRVVAAAAIIMISVFAGFIGMSSPTIQTMGVGLAAAVAFDAFVVRMAIAPAVLALLGPAGEQCASQDADQRSRHPSDGGHGRSPAPRHPAPFAAFAPEGFLPDGIPLVCA